MDELLNDKQRIQRTFPGFFRSETAAVHTLFHFGYIEINNNICEHSIVKLDQTDRQTNITQKEYASLVQKRIY